MSNITNLSSATSFPKLTIAELLALFGFSPFSILTFQFVLPSLALFGIILSSISFYIFMIKRAKFMLPLYFYYRLLNAVYLVQLTVVIPYGFCFTPLYLSGMNAYACRVFTIAYEVFAQFCMYYTGCLEIFVLLDRMRDFSDVIKKRFNLAPSLSSLAMFCVCVLVDAFFAFNYVPGTRFEYYDFVNRTKVTGAFYVADVSPVASSAAGYKALLTLYAVRDLFTLIVGVTLNVVSLFQFKRFLARRTQTLGVRQQQTTSSLPINFSAKKLKKKTVSTNPEKNLFFMILTLCSVSIFTRLTLIATNAYFLFHNDKITLVLVTLTDLVIVLGPCMSFFVFILFNKVFRVEFYKLFKKVN